MCVGILELLVVLIIGLIALGMLAGFIALIVVLVKKSSNNQQK